MIEADNFRIVDGSPAVFTAVAFIASVSHRLVPFNEALDAYESCESDEWAALPTLTDEASIT